MPGRPGREGPARGSTPPGETAGTQRLTGWRFIVGMVLLGAGSQGIILCLPGFVSAVVENLRFTEQQAGWVVVFMGAGGLLGAFLAIWMVTRVDLRRTCLTLLVVSAALELGCVLAPSMSVVCGLQFVIGVTIGCVGTLAFGLIARSTRPDTVIGIVCAMQLLVGGLLVLILPTVTGSLSMRGGMFLFFAAWFVALFALSLAFVPHAARPAREELGTASDFRWGVPLLVGLAAVLAAYFAYSAQWTYMERIGTELVHMGDQAAATALSASTVAGVAGGVLAAVVGTRFGRVLPVTGGMLVMAVATVVLMNGATPVRFWIVCCVSNMAFTYCGVPLTGYFATLDPLGRAITAASFVLSVGLTVGPLVAAQLVGGGYRIILSVSVVGFLAAAAIFASAVFVQRRAIAREGVGDGVAESAAPT